MQPPFLLSYSLPLSVQTSYANGPLFMSRARAAHLEHLVKRRLIIQTGNWRRTLIEIRDKRRHALLPPSHNEVGFKMHLHCLDRSSYNNLISFTELRATKIFVVFY